MTVATQPELLIRRFLPSDAAGLHAYLSRPEAVRFEPYGVQSAADCVRLAVERATSPDFWAVCLRSSGELVARTARHYDITRVPDVNYRHQRLLSLTQPSIIDVHDVTS